MGENRVRVQHDVEPWTVGRLRESLEGLPDGLPVQVLVNHEPFSSQATGYVAVAASVDGGLISASARGLRYQLQCAAPSGTYLRPRRAELTVIHGDTTSAESDDILRRLIERVRELRASTDYKGESDYHRATADTSVWRWTPSAHTLVSAEAVLDAARAAAHELNPGTWRVESRLY
jgi:hypothetical protein